MRKGHRVNQPLNQIGCVVLIRADCEVDSAANTVLLPEGSKGTPLLRAFKPCLSDFIDKVKPV